MQYQIIWREYVMTYSREAEIRSEWTEFQVLQYKTEEHIE